MAMADKLIIGASGGIGGAFRRQLGARYPEARVLGTSRSGADGLFALDLSDSRSIDSFVEALATQEFKPDQILIATGLLHTEEHGPEKSYRGLNADWLAQVMQVNATGPIYLLSRLIGLLDRSAQVQVGVLSARVGSISDNRLGGWYAYRASKAALNMYLKTLAIELARTHKQVQILSLHPGTTDTALSKPFQARVPEDKLFTPEFAAQCLLGVMQQVAGGESGQFLAWDGKPIPW